MITCKSCGFENPDDGKFCTGCGGALERRPAAPDGPAKFCTECGAKIPADSNFCTDCGKGFGASPAGPGSAPAPGGPPPAGGTAWAAEYLAAVDTRLAAAGFERIEAPAVLALERFLRRKKFELAQIGMVTAVCGIKVLEGPATVAYVKDFSRTVFDAANAKKGFLARNAMQQLLVYPVVVAPSAEAAVAEFLASHWPKHWMGFEFTIVAVPGDRQLLLHRSTPVWQALSHTGFKKQAESLFAV